MTSLHSPLIRCTPWLAIALTCLLTTTAPTSFASTSDSNHASSAVTAPDAMFSKPYIDRDEWRDTPVRHRYVHGGFKDTATRFSFYLPAKEQYQGRFFHYITPVPDSENLSQGATGEEDKIGFAIASGAYFVETNGGGRSATATIGSGIDSSIGAYRANAAAAQYSRQVAMAMYGGQRPYGYAFGGSGGGFRTIGGIENTEGVWDGAVPFVIGSSMAIPNVFTVRMYALRVLRDKLPTIADAVDAGSLTNPYDGLNDEEAAALREVSRMGFPLQAWYAHSVLDLHGFAVLFPGVVAADPGYFQDFWTQPGYEGYQPTASLLANKIHHRTTIKRLITADEAKILGVPSGPLAGQARGRADDAWAALQGQNKGSIPVAMQLASIPDGNAMGADLLIQSGTGKGSKLPVNKLYQDYVLLGAEHAEILAKLTEGDEVLIDNANFLAVQTYHRHQIPGPDFNAWDQFKDADGKPLYPQRPMLLGPIFTMGASGTVPNGKFKGKMIVVANLHDTEAYPWQADWYRSKVRENLGDKTEQHFRLWYTDRANHGDSGKQKQPTQTVSYLGVLQQALRDLGAWVEKDIPPPATTDYQVVEGQVKVPTHAEERHGIQPAVTLTANGKARAEVRVGEPVELVAAVAVPPKTGLVVDGTWDLDGSGTFPTKVNTSDLLKDKTSFKLTHSYAKPGTYFAVVRVASQRQGDAVTPFARVQNLARARIVVTE